MDVKKTNKKQVVRQNVVESLKDLSSDFTAQGTDLLKNTSEDFFRELIGLRNQSQPKSGEIKAGESLEMNEMLKGQVEENRKLKAQISFERNLAAEERMLSERKMQELRIQLTAIAQEISKMAISTANLATQTEIAMVEVPINPGVYHVVFFEKVLEFLVSFRKKIDQASVWLEGANKRAGKKMNYWARYKKGRGSFLLSPDHYLQRSAG